MERQHIRFDHKCEHYRASIFCLVSLAVSFTLAASVFFSPQFYGNYSVAGMLYYISSCLLEDFALILPSISFFILLRTSYRRYAGLNSLLRFWFPNILHLNALWFLFCFNLEQRSILKGKSTGSANEQESINTIKFIGRKYSLLTGIIEQLNFCYSVQVWIRLVFWHSISSI